MALPRDLRVRPPHAPGRDAGRLPQPLPPAHRGPLPHPREHPAQAPTQPWVSLAVVEEHAEGLVCLSGCAREGVLAGALGARRALRPRRSGWQAPAGRLRRARACGSSCSDPTERHDRARNRWLAGLAERLGRALRRDRQRPLPPPLALPPAGCPRRGPQWRRPGGVRAAAARQLKRGACLPAGDGARASPSIPRPWPRPPGSPSGLRFDLTSELGYRYPGSEDAGADRKLAEDLRALLVERYAGSPQRARGRAPARGGAGDDPRPRPLRLLPPAPRPARAGPRGRRGGARPRLGPLAAAAGPRPGLQRQLDRLLPDRPLPRRPGRRPTSSPGASSTTRSTCDARHRPRLPPRHPRGADPPRPRALRPRALGPGRRLPHLPPARRGARPRQGAGAARRGDRAGRAGGRLPRRGGGDRAPRRRGDRRRARRLAALARAGRRSAPRRWACPATPPSTPAGW